MIFLDKVLFKDERKEGFQGKATVASVLCALFSLPQLCIGIDVYSRAPWDNFSRVTQSTTDASQL